MNAARRRQKPDVNETIDLPLYTETLVFLVTAGVVAPLFFRLRVSPVLGFLLAGVLLGPYSLGRLVGRAPWLSAIAITNVETIDHIAAFGVVVLLFTMGLELSFERLRRMRRLVFGLGFGPGAGDDAHSRRGRLGVRPRPGPGADDRRRARACPRRRS